MSSSGFSSVSSWVEFEVLFVELDVEMASESLLLFSVELVAPSRSDYSSPSELYFYVELERVDSFEEV